MVRSYMTALMDIGQLIAVVDRVVRTDAGGCVPTVTVAARHVQAPA